MSAILLSWMMRKPSRSTSLAVYAVILIVWGLLRLVVFRTCGFPLSDVLPLLVCMWTRDRWGLWIVAAILAVMAAIDPWAILPSEVHPGIGHWANYCATLFDILVGAGAVHLVIFLRQGLEHSLTQTQAAQEQAQAQATELARQNEELAQQSEELSQQTEELTQQNEEHQVQSEEIRHLNDELIRRESLLQKLLDAARFAHGELGVMQEICAAGLDIFGDATVAVVVYERQAGQLVLRTSATASDVVLPEARPAENTFADLVIQQNRTAGLNDTSLRPDLKLLEIPGRQSLGAVLCSPLQQAGLAYGAIAVYSVQPQEWTDEQFRLIEWLAGQCAHILETLRFRNELQRQAALINLSPDGIMVRKIDGTITLWSRGAEMLYGWTKDEACGRRVHELLGTEISESLESINRTLQQTGKWIGELLHTTKDGRKAVVQSRWLARRDAQGPIVEILESNVDVTERKRAEERLQASEYRLRMALQAAGGGVWDWDLTNDEAWWSPEMYALWGVEPGTRMSLKNTLPLIHEHDRERLSRTVEEAIARCTDYHCEFRVCHATRGERWMVSLGRVLVDETGKRVRLIGISVDITERKGIETAIQQSRDTLSAVLNAAPAGVVVADTQGGILLANAASQRIFGGPVTGDIPGPDGGYRVSIPDGSPVPSKPFPLSLALAGQVVTDSEFLVTRGDGTQISILANATPLQTRAGDIWGAVAVFQDISDRKRAEEERLEMERRLLHTQKLESLGVLAGGIAHDFNNILAGIMGYADLAAARLPASEPALADLTEIRKASQRAADLTRQMLAYSGKGKFVVEPVNLSQCVEEVRRMLELSVSKKATLKYHLLPNLPAIEADASQISQVVMNLVINASEALGEEGGVISVLTDTVRYDGAKQQVAACGEELAEGLYVRLEVADTGCGMDPQTRAKFFDPFFTTKFTGRGLGLAAVQGIVRGHKGAIRVFSEPDKGTTFQVLFPADGQASAVPPGKSATIRSWRGQGTVLVVDDEEIVRNLACQMIEHLGFTTLAAKDGQEAVEIFREHQNRIVCVLLDLTMPKLGGDETFRELRRIRPDVRVILSSGYNEENATERFDRLELAGFIQKPYQFETMIERLRVAMTDSFPLSA